MMEDLKPGRELDALVASKIFGYRLDQHAGSAVVILPSGEWDPLPDYSSDIAAAWTVVENLRSRKRPGDTSAFLDFSIEQKDRLEGGHWCVQTDGLCPDKNGYYHQVWVHAETAPLAICLAALKALGK